MENKSKKPDLKSKLVRDAGDVRKMDKSVTSGGHVAKLNDKPRDRGDSAKIGVEKIKISDRKVADVLPKNIERTLNAPPPQPKEGDRRKRDEYQTKDPQTKIAEKKKIRDNYTFRNKYSCEKKAGECFKKSSDEKVESDNDRVKWHIEEVKLASPPAGACSPKHPLNSVVSQKETNRVKSPPAQQVIRRTIIKTITSKNDKTKVYKAVNFVDKKVHPTPLQINIPTDYKRSKETKAKSVLSKISLKEKRRRDKKKRSVRSPSASPNAAVSIRSPPTEMAKWTSADNHKKLYYEAWVDTTLAAISKKVKNKKFDNIKLMQTFEKALAERPASPEIDYNLMLDEKYTGKIKVNKR